MYGKIPEQKTPETVWGGAWRKDWMGMRNSADVGNTFWWEGIKGQDLCKSWKYLFPLSGTQSLHSRRTDPFWLPSWASSCNFHTWRLSLHDSGWLQHFSRLPSRHHKDSLQGGFLLWIMALTWTGGSRLSLTPPAFLELQGWAVALTWAGLKENQIFCNKQNFSYLRRYAVKIVQTRRL